MIPIVGVSLEEALLGFGDDDAELHDKEVTLTTSDVTGSQTAVFEYDPQSETPTPWDGYSLFTIDLSDIKDDIEDLQQQVSDLEDELEEMQECCDEVLDVIHDYDPTYDPHPDPPDPTNPTIPEKIQEIIDEQKGVVVPDGVDPAPIALELNGTVTDADIQASVQIVCRVSTNPDVYIEMAKVENPPYNVFYPFVKVSYVQDGVERIDYLPCIGSIGLSINGEYGMITGYSISTSGVITINGVWHYYDATGWHDRPVSGQTGSQYLVGWGDTGHTQRITN